MEEFKNLLNSSGFSGDLDTTESSLEFYSHDASLFEIKPKLIVAPKDSGDVQKLVKLVAENKH